MATSKAMSLPLSLLFLSLILLLAPATKADITLFSSDHPHGNSILTDRSKRTRINGGETLTDGAMDLVVKRDCSIFLYFKVNPLPVFVLRSDIQTEDCYLYVSNRGVLTVHTKDIKMADKPIFGAESTEGRYALVLHWATLAIYGPAIWSNGVGKKEARLRSSFLVEEEFPSAISTSDSNAFYSGAMMEGSQNGDVEVAKEGHVTAYLRPDCTLAVQHKNGKVLWSTETRHTVIGQCKLELLSNGLLVIRDYFPVAREGKKFDMFVEVFNSGSPSKDDNSYICLLFVDGEMAVYDLKDGMFKGLPKGIANMAMQ